MSKKLISTYKFVPGVVTPDTNLFPNTVALIYANRNYIIEEAIAYIQYNSTNNISPFAYYTYDAAKCRRDIAYVLDGYISDLRHGGNRQTVFNASKYFENGVPQVDGNRQPEVYAHTFIKELIDNYILENQPFTGRQSTITQFRDINNIPEPAGKTKVGTLATSIIAVITNGLISLPAVVSNRGYVKFPGFYKLKDILLVTNTTQNVILYNFADNTYRADLTYYESTNDVDFPGAQYGFEKVTSLVFDYDTSQMMVTDQIQIFVEAKEQAVRLNSIATDAMERMKVGIPQSMLDADFEYGLQPTKWQTISMMRNYPSVYEIPGSDLPVVSVTTDASNGTSNVGASAITVVTGASHGFLVGDVFTIKALAASVKGFGRAEGTFQVATVPSSTSFTYYAKSKVGTINPTLLSSNYTQLRKAGYYTGASVGTPSFTVYSNGQSGTLTTNLTTASGSTFIGFTGSPPPVGAPLSGTGINTGTQVTAVTGAGGTVAVTQLTSTANINDTSLVVASTVGINPGLAFNRGDGVAVQVTDVTGNVVSISAPLTSQILGTNQTYQALSGTTSGNGTGATFDISRTASAYLASVATSNGQGYIAGDTITFLGTALNASTPGNDAVITVASASSINSVASFDFATLNTPSGYFAVSDTGVIGYNGSGTGLTVDITADVTGAISDVAINNPGVGYLVGDVISLGGSVLEANPSITILTVNPGGDILSFTITGQPVAAPSNNFVSALTLNDTTNAQITSGNTGITYTSIATIQIQFSSAHGFIPGDSVTTQITSAGSNAQLAAGSFYVEEVPSATTLRFTARAPGIITNTLTGVVYARPDSYFVHRPYDGGVQLGTGGPAHGATAIRMSKKYIRYQSGKGVMYNTGALFAPSYDIATISSTSTSVGAVITLATDDTDHGCQVGAQITINGVTTSGYNGIYTVSKIVDERTLQVLAVTVLGATSAILGSPCQMSILHWHGATVRSGTFDDQNGMFWQYDGIRMAVVKRSSTNQIAGTISIQANNNLITGSNTRFTQQLAQGDRIVIKGMSHVVSSITNDTTMTVTPDYRGVNDVVNGKAMKTIDLVVPQENWNLDPLNGSGPSGYNIDVTKMQMIGMQWTWYGAGFIDFMLRGPQGDYVFCHRFRNSNVNSEAYMRTGNQPVRYEVINEGAKDQATSAIDATQTTIPISNGFYFPSSGVVIIDSELIRYTGNTGTALTGCVRGSSLTQFVAGSTRTFKGSPASTHLIRSGVVLVSSTVTPIISHWGSAFMIDGQFDSDRGYLFNYASTGITASVDKATAFLIRLAPSVSNAQTGDLGERELLNRAQLLLQGISVVSETVAGTGSLVIEGVLNPSNYPTDPTKISWTGLSASAAGGQPSFAQIAPGGSVTWSGNFSNTTSTVQGAFTTTLTAKSFAPSTSSLTAVGFAAVTQSATASSFGFASLSATALGFNTGTPFTGASQTLTALGFAANQPYGNSTYVSATSTVRNDILITNTQYDALQAGATPILLGDTVTGPGIAANTFITTITRAYNAGAYTRIIFNQNMTVTSTAGNGNNITLTTSTASRYNSATSIYRTDVLMTNTQYNALALVPQVGDTISGTGIASGTTISSITTSYLGTIYTRIVLSTAMTATSTAGTGNNIALTISTAYSPLYRSAFSTGRNDFLLSNTAYDTLVTGTPLVVGDGISASTYVSAGQTITGITRSYITINSTLYTRIVMSGVANNTSTAALTNGANDISVTFTSSQAAVYNNAISSTRSDFLITQTQYASISANFKVTDVLSATTYVTGSQTVSSITPSYATIGGVAYARVIMSGNGNASSTAGANNVSITSTSAFTATYGPAFNTNRADFLVTDAEWTASGIAAGDGLAVATYITGGQNIASVQVGYVSLGGTSYTRVLMNGNANGTSTSGSGNDVTVTVTATGSATNYVKTNYLFFTSATWIASGATISTKVATDQTRFPAGTSVNGITTRVFGATTVYRVSFTQSATGTFAAADTLKYQFGSAYALPGEQVFSFLSNPGGSDTLPLQDLKELTSTSIGGRGTFPNGPDVLAINIYKTSGSSTTANVILRWGEAQA